MGALNDRDLDSMVDYLLGRVAKGKRIAPPVDLFALARLQRVTTVDFRPMLPTGGLGLRSSGFVIYIQDLGRSEPFELAVGGPVESRPKMTTRQRFTMAHELAHTLLFDSSDSPQPRAGAPKGKKLEAVCHYAARRILMPETLMTAEIARRGRPSSRDILDLARIFDVSVDVTLRRYQELAAVRDSDRVVLYVRKSSTGGDEIAGFFCSKWFQDNKGSPEIGMTCTKWLSGFVDESFWSAPKPKSTVTDADGEIDIALVDFGSAAYFVELERRHRDRSLFLSNQPSIDSVDSA